MTLSIIRLQSKHSNSNNLQQLTVAAECFGFRMVDVFALRQLLIECTSVDNLVSVWIDIAHLDNTDPTKDLFSLQNTIHQLRTSVDASLPSFAITIRSNLAVDTLKKLVAEKVSVLLDSDLKIKNVCESLFTMLKLSQLYHSPSVQHLLVDQPALFERQSTRKPHVSWLVPGCPTSLRDSVLKAFSYQTRLVYNTFESWPTLLRCLSMNTYVTDLLIIDHSVLASEQDQNIMNMINCIHMVRSSCANSRNCHDLKIYVAVNHSTVSGAQARQLLKIPGVNGVCPILGVGCTSFEFYNIFQQMLNGERIVTNCVNTTNNSITTSSRNAQLRLTERQQQIFQMVSEEGASNKVIANRLKITEGAVKRHISKLLKKHGLTNRTELAALVN